MNKDSRTKARKISLEEYLKFFHFGKHFDLPVNRINQILSVHGFKPIKLKKDKAEAMESLVLINLSRSTLSDSGASSGALMNLEDIIADVNELNWQDCCITSFQAIDFSSHDQSTTGNLSSVPNSVSNDELETALSVVKYSRKRKEGSSGYSVD